MRFGYHHLQKRAQSYTSLMAILHQDISGTGKRRFKFDTLLIWVNVPMTYVIEQFLEGIVPYRAPAK